MKFFPGLFGYRLLLLRDSAVGTHYQRNKFLRQLPAFSFSARASPLMGVEKLTGMLVRGLPAQESKNATSAARKNFDIPVQRELQKYLFHRITHLTVIGKKWLNWPAAVKVPAHLVHGND